MAVLLFIVNVAIGICLELIWVGQVGQDSSGGNSGGHQPSSGDDCSLCFFFSAFCRDLDFWFDSPNVGFSVLIEADTSFFGGSLIIIFSHTQRSLRKRAHAGNWRKRKAESDIFVRVGRRFPTLSDALRVIQSQRTQNLPVNAFTCARTKNRVMIESRAILKNWYLVGVATDCDKWANCVVWEW